MSFFHTYYIIIMIIDASDISFTPLRLLIRVSFQGRDSAKRRPPSKGVKRDFQGAMAWSLGLRERK